MNAQEARKKSESKFIDLESALKQITVQVEYGGTEVIFMIELQKEVSTELMRLGYKLTIHKDPINGSENHICSW